MASKSGKPRIGDRLLMSLRVTYEPDDENMVTVEVGGQRVTLRVDDNDIVEVRKSGRDRPYS